MNIKLHVIMARPTSSISEMSHHTEKTHSSTLPSQRASPITPAHHSWRAFSGPVLFTGPSGLRDFRVATQHEFQMVGEVDRSTEVTSQIGYLNRTAPGQEFPKAKNGQAGEIGWLYDKHKVVKGI